MGLIRVALGAVGGVISDQYKEYFICDALPDNVLVRRASRNTDGKTRNNGSENIISNGSLIVVNPGQAMAIVDQGRIVEFTADPGPFVYDSSAEPSIFEGKLGKNIVDSFKTIGRRIAFGGNTGRDQRVYYFNLLEIKNNLYGTPTPVMFRAVDRNIGLDMDVDLRCNGTYTYFLEDPILFFEKFSGNIKGDYTREDMNEMLRNSFVMALQPALGKIAELEIRPNQISSHVVELRDAMREFLKPDWTPRGIRLGEITMNPPSLPADQAESIRELQRTAVLRSADMAAATLTGAQAEAMKAAAGNAGGAAIGAAYKADMAAVNEYLANPAVRELFPADIAFKWGVKGDDKIDGRFYLYAIRISTPDGKAPLDGSVVTEAREQYAQRGANAVVSMSMNGEGTQEWARLTGENIGKCIAIVLDGYVYSAPRVNTKIDKGSSEISGDFTIQEAKDLANVLNSGKVPAPAKIIQDTVVGPSLGQESINAGMLSFLIAFILVLLYMGLFYKTAGWMSDIALLTNVFLLMGVLVSFGAVLTLPGIAGIVLTMGMAVDANVIIYERIKEELRGGKGLSLAIKDGFSKAYSAIIDGNLTTIITGIVLFIFGNGPVQGFATTLIIGIITSFFSAVFITRLLIEWIVAKWGNISFSRKWSENFLTNTHFDFIRVRKVAYTVAVALLALSCISFVARGLNLGAEFTGGRAYVIRFDKPVSAEEVRQNLGQVFAQHADADASAISFEVKQYGNENQMRIVTQYRYDDTSDEATAEVEQIIYDAMKSLYSYDISFEQFRNTQTDVNGILTADKIGPSIAKDMTWNAIYSVLFSLIAIGLYITFRFKRWQWASGATIALAVNALFIIGLFSMLYGFVPFNLEVNQAFIAAILTIIGYAINDTVVVFDRIREYLGMYPKRNLKENVNNAINSTLSRTINTSGTTLVTLLAIFFFGGETIRGFIFALTVGVIVGTVATIFIATPIAYDLMSKRAKLDKEA